MTVKITPNDRGNPPGKLADAELHFSEGPLEGLKLIGFSIWERNRGGGGGRNVPFSPRPHNVNGQGRQFSLPRPRLGTKAAGQFAGAVSGGDAGGGGAGGGGGGTA